MTLAFAERMFSPAVKAAQSQYGSRRINQRREDATDRQDELSVHERDFVESSDGFFQATVGETEWPYVQCHGGPPGFLEVLDAKALGFADFRGNVQYVSVGNLAADERIALILIDQRQPARLKILGRAQVVDARDDPALAATLTMPTYAARVERVIVIDVEAFDWNCPQHITPRFTEAEVLAMIAPMKAELAVLRARLEAA